MFPKCSLPGAMRERIFRAPFSEMVEPTLHDRGVIARWRQFLPVSDATPVVSLNEGSTPLIHSPRLSAIVGRGAEVIVKYEGLNPTGSFKDGGMTMAIYNAVD